jgi:hypothetical protein
MPSNKETKKKSVRRTRKLPPFQNGEPLQLVITASQWEGDAESVAVVDATSGGLWRGFTTAKSAREDGEELRPIDLPPIPGPDTAWISCAIGGVSQTQRRVGVLRGRDNELAPVSLFALRCVPDASGVVDMIRSDEWKDKATVGDPIEDEAEGWAVEVIVHSARDLSVCAARIARLGAEVVMDEASAPLEAGRSLGIERLDRIDAAILQRDVGPDQFAYGLKRGVANWAFGWQPPEWKFASFNWDQLVNNVKDTMPISEVPPLLLQHVAAYKLLHGEVSKVGQAWAQAPAPLHGTVKVMRSDDARRRLSGVREARTVLPTPVVGAKADSLVRAEDGQWWKCFNEEKYLQSYARLDQRRRLVSAHLTTAQSRQLITAFYLACVERSLDPIVLLAARIVLFQYLVHSGYTGRWLGQYVQSANHVGNGNRLRSFRRLRQYDVERLPVAMLNRWLRQDGELVPNGLASVSRRGSRSKYVKEQDKYKPRKRLKRTAVDEEVMLKQ